MRVALICRPLSYLGGVETATAGLLAELVRRGHEVTLLSTVVQGPVPGVTVRRLPVLRAPAALRAVTFALVAWRAVAAGAHDIVQSHERVLRQDVYRAGEGTHRGYLAAMGRRARTPYHRLVLALERRIFTLRSARHVVAIADRGRREIEALYGTPPACLSRIYNGVDLERFSPHLRGRLGLATRAALGLAPDAWTVVFVGSGFERKGLDVVIQGLAAAADRTIRLVVAGRGRPQPYRALAARLGIEQRVVWTGPVRDVERLYAIADVVALPARYEPFGNVHLEALAAGVPVLSSAAAGGAEVIAQGANGWVVEAAEPGAVTRGLDALRDADPGRLRVAARGAAEPFTYVAQGAAFEALYRSLAS